MFCIPCSIGNVASSLNDKDLIIGLVINQVIKILSTLYTSCFDIFVIAISY